jgi:alpha-ketoglutarate-dependent taurine dioxygenase
MDPTWMQRMRTQFPQVEHPVVRTHPVTGKKSVNVNPMYCNGIKVAQFL